MIIHKGYIAKIEFDEDDKVLHGRILGIRDVITFEADSVEGAIAAFEESVDDYLAAYSDESGHRIQSLMDSSSS